MELNICYRSPTVIIKRESKQDMDEKRYLQKVPSKLRGQEGQEGW